MISQTCVGVSEQVDELSTSLQTARGQEAAAGEELRSREETIRTLHSGDVIPSSSPLLICSSSGFYCDLRPVPLGSSGFLLVPYQ